MSAYPLFHLAALPGVRMWLDRLRADLRSGRSCLWLLPRSAIGGPDCAAERLLDDLLNDVHDFILLPANDHEPVPAAATPSHQWAGTIPVIDYDDGLSILDLPPGLHHRQDSRRTPAAASDALTELLERLGKELFTRSGSASGDSPNRTQPRTSDHVTHPTLERLVGSNGVPETRPVVVRAWREATPLASTHLLRQLVGAIREAGLPPADRPRSLVVVAAEDLPSGMPDQLAREDIAVHWWWGTTNRLDTATVVALTRPSVDGPADRHLLEAVAQATITEICGPFLTVAASLSEAWDGRPETLLDELRRIAAAMTQPADTRVPRWDASHRPGRRPNAEILAAWSAAAVDSWDGRLRRHPASDIQDAHFVATRTWLAQNHALLPLLDGAREMFTRTVRRRTRLPLEELVRRYGPRMDRRSVAPPPDEGTEDALRTMELGAMWGAHVNGDIALARTERDLLRLLWTARNRLAHRQPLDGTGLQRLATELCR